MIGLLISSAAIFLLGFLAAKITSITYVFIPRSIFITGSRAYGTPREDSDLDVVLLADENTAKIMWRFYKVDSPFPKNAHSIRMKIGDIDFIVCLNKKSFDLWHKGTQMLKARAPVTKPEAVEQFNNLFPKYKNGSGYNPISIPTPLMVDANEAKMKSLLK